MKRYKWKSIACALLEEMQAVFPQSHPMTCECGLTTHIRMPPHFFPKRTLEELQKRGEKKCRT